MLQVRLLPAIGLIRQERQRPVIALLLVEVMRIIRMLGLASWGVYQLHQAPAAQVVVLAIAVTQVLHDLLLQGRDDNSLNEVANQWIATFFFFPFVLQ